MALSHGDPDPVRFRWLIPFSALQVRLGNTAGRIQTLSNVIASLSLCLLHTLSHTHTDSESPFLQHLLHHLLQAESVGLCLKASPSLLLLSLTGTGTDSSCIWELIHSRSEVEGRPETVFQLCSRSGVKLCFFFFGGGGSGMSNTSVHLFLFYAAERGHLFQGLRFI